MALQSLLAKAGLRLSTLGTAASLAFAFPLSEGNPSTAAHTDATRTGFYGVAGAKVATVVNGVEALSVLATGVSVPGMLTVAGVAYTWPGANAVGALVNNGSGVLSWTPVATISSNIQAPQIAFASGLNALTGDPNLVYTGLQVGVGTPTPAAKLDILGTDLVTSANNAIASLFTHAPLTKNDANVRQFYGAMHKPTFNTGGSNTTTTYNVLQVDTVNTSVTGLTVNLFNLAFGGVSRFNVASGGAVTIPSTSLSIGGVTYAWPALQGAAASMLQNDGAGNLAWNVMSGDATLSNTGVLTLATVIAAAGPVGSSSVVPVITYDAKGRLTAVTTATITPASIGAIGGTIAAPQVAFGSGANTINGDANFVYTSTQLGLGTSTPAAKLDIIGTDLATAADLSVANIFAHTTLTKNTGTTRTFFGSLYKPTFNTGGSNTTTTYNVLAIDSVNTSLTGLTVNLLNLSFGGAQALLLDSSGKLTLPRSGAGTGDFTFGLTGTPVANATSSQVRIGSAITTGNAAANGGTYFGINGAAAGAGSAADIMLLQANGLDLLRVQANRFMRINGATDDTGNPPAALSIASTVSSQNYALYLDNTSDLTGAGALVIRTQGITGGAKVICVRNTNHPTSFSFTLGSLGAMAWGSGDAVRDVQFSRTTTTTGTLQVDNNGVGSTGGDLLIFGKLLVRANGGGSTVDANAALTVNGQVLNTNADQAISVMSTLGSVTKNDSNTRQFYGSMFKPTFNTGASNLNTTYNVLNVDTVNTSVTGLTVNLLSLNSGGTNVFLVNSTGVVTIPRDGAGAGNYTLGLIGRPNQSASSSLFRLGNPIIGGNNITNGGTYIGINTPGSLAGSAADFVNFQKNGGPVFNITVDGLTGIGSAASASTALLLPASTTTISSLRAPHGTAPTAPVNGDIWTTTVAMFVQINGSTVQLGASGGGTIGGSIAANQVAYGLGANTIQGSGNLTYDGTTFTSASQVVVSKAGAASTPAETLTGTWFTGGSTTTTKPQLLIEPTGTTSTTWSTSGTALGINGASGFVGRLLDLKTNNLAMLTVDASGNGFFRGTLSTGGNAGFGVNADAVATAYVSATSTLTSAVSGSTHMLLADGSITKNNATVATYYGVSVKPTFNTGGSNSGTTYTILNVDSVVTSAVGVTVNLLSLNHNGLNFVLVASGGQTTLASRVLNIGGVSYLWPASQGSASTVLTNDGSGNLSWAAGGGGGGIGGTIAVNQIAYGSGTNTIQGSANLTYNGTVATLTGALTTGSQTLLALSETVSGTGAGGNNVIGLSSAVTNSKTGGTAVTSLAGALLTVAASGSGGSTTSISGLSSSVTVGAGHTANNAAGVRVTVSTDPACTINTVYMLNVGGSADGSLTTVHGALIAPGAPGTLTDFNGITAAPSTIGGTVTNMRVVNVAPQIAAATVTNLYCVFINPGDVSAVTNSYGVFQSGSTLVNYFAGSITSDLAQVESQPGIRQNGSWFTGGSTTTTKPMVLIEPNGTSSTNWSVNGTGLGVNADPSFTGDLISLQVGGLPKLNVDATGSIFNGGGITTGSGISCNGQLTVNVNPGAGGYGGYFNGVWFTGGDGTTTKPMLLVEPVGISSFGWNPSGTGLGINADPSFTGSLVALQVNAVNQFTVDYLGNAFIAGDVTLKHLSVYSAYTSTSISPGGGLGSGGNATLGGGSGDIAGQITLNTGTGASSASTLATVTFQFPYPGSTVFVTLTPADATTAAAVGTIYVTASGNTSFDINAGATALTDSTTYTFYYTVVGSA